MQTLLVLDRHPIFREALAALLRVSLPAVGLFCTGDCNLIGEIEPDLCFVDLDRMDFANAIGGLVAPGRGTAVVGTLEKDDFSVVAHAFAAGASAVISKAAGGEEFVRLTRYLLGRTQERPVFEPSSVVFANSAAANGSVFSETEMRLIRLLARGLKNRDIARELGFSVNTVKVYNSRLYRRFGVTTRTKLVLRLRGG